MRVYIGCFGSGLGHASRMLEIAGALRARGDQVEFSSSGEVATLIERKGYRCNLLPLADVRYSNTGAFLVRETLLDTSSILWRTNRQVALELVQMGRFGPDVVLSDSALPTVIAGRILRLPTFTVLNQLNLASSHGEERALARLLSVGISAGMGRLWELSDAVILPDLPPPYTISEKNLWGSNVEKTRYVGFLLPSEESIPDAAAEEFQGSKLPKVFWQVSGPPPTRIPFLRRALDCSDALSGRYSFVVSGGDPLGETNPRRIRGGWFYDWCSIAGYFFSKCDVVVSRAGHGTIGQAMVAAKPSLLVPIPHQPEQEGNAEKAAKLGTSIVIGQDELTTARVMESLDQLIEGNFIKKSEVLGRFARGFNAKGAILDCLDQAVKRGHPIRH
jgi:UDP-N-acetylglucosamine--N-acetylmuramyl-(pentapeptide) pyrophosphoryl-undecaprenol N-acetylglucosamine transferase